MTTSISDPREDPEWEFVRAAAHRVTPTPPGLVTRVLKSVRGIRGALVSESFEVALDGDRLRISERVLVLLTRQLGLELSREIGGVYISAVAMETQELQVLVAIRYGLPVETTAELLRNRLREAITLYTGLTAPPLNVHIVDVRSR